MGRVFATGGLRFRLNSWFDLQQVGGGFETGLQNRVPVDLGYRVRSGERLRPGREAADTTMYLEALGAQYVVVHGRSSREYYRDFVRPERIAATPLWKTEDDAIYALPARPIAHVMREGEIVREDPLEHPEALERYVAGIEDAARPKLTVGWQSASSLTIGGAPGGALISLQVNADPGWQVTGAEAISDRLGFLVLRASGGPIKLRYNGTTEQRVFAGLSALAWIGIVVLGITPRASRYFVET